MPYVQTSLNNDELAMLHYRAKTAGKSIQRIVYEFIIDGLDKLKKENEDDRRKENQKVD